MKTKKTITVVSFLVSAVLVGLVLAQPAESPVMVGKVFTITIAFNEPMDLTVTPVIVLSNPTITATKGVSLWTSDKVFTQKYSTTGEIEVAGVDVGVTGAKDVAGNVMLPDSKADVFSIDTKPPVATGIGCSNN